VCSVWDSILMELYIFCLGWLRFTEFVTLNRFISPVLYQHLKFKCLDAFCRIFIVFGCLFIY